MSNSSEDVLTPIPKVSLLQTLFRALFSGQDERVDMRSVLSRQYDELGPVVLLDLGIMKMVNLFGPDAHMCLGFRFAELQVKAVIHQLVQRFRISLLDGYEMPVQQAPISKPRDGLPILLEAIG